MLQITLEDVYITPTDLSNFIEYFQKVKKGGDKHLRIIASKELEDVTVLLPAYLMLFKLEYQEILIEIHLPYNKIFRDKNSVSSKFMQYATYAYLMCEIEVFQLYFEGNSEAYSITKRGNKGFSRGCFVLSSKFMLLLLANQQVHKGQLFKYLFYEGPGSKVTNWFLPNIPLPPTTSPGEVYSYYHTSITDNANPLNCTDSVLDLGRLSFLKALAESKIMSYYIRGNIDSDEILEQGRINIGNLKYSEEFGNRPFKYYILLKPIFDELAKMPLIYTFMFSQLMTSGVFTDNLELDPNSTANQILTLWNFTKDLCYGWREIVSNSVEHSSTRTGVICARFLKKVDGEKSFLSPDYRLQVTELEDSIRNQAHSILEIHAIDLSEHGILDTLLASTQNLKLSFENNDELYKIFEKDIEQLTTGHIKLANLIKPEPGKFLLHQSKRSLAHLGLMIFNQLVTCNKGILGVSSINHSDPTDIQVGFDYIRNPLSSIRGGTIFSCLLPVIPGKTYSTNIPQPAVTLPYRSDFQQMEGIEALLEIQYLKSDMKPDLLSESKKYLLEIPCNWPCTRDAEELAVKNVHVELDKRLSELPKDSACITGFNFNNATIDASQLFRFMGYFETNFPQHTQIIYNIPYSIFDKLIWLNKQFQDIQNLAGATPFWSNTNISLIYHYIEQQNKTSTKRFYFTDAVWGSNRENFYQLNKMIRRNHFNATSLTAPEMKQFDNGIRSLDFRYSPVFYNKNVLLPMDVLLDGNGISIFEHNADVLLNNLIHSNQH